MNYKDFYQEINNKSLTTLYLFTGREMYIANSMLKLAINSVLKEEEREFNLIELKSEELEFSQFYNALNTLPLFSEKRIMVIQCNAIFNSALWNDGDLKCLKFFFEKNVQSDTLVFFISESVDERNKFFKAIKNLGKIVEYDKITEDELSEWINKQFKLSETKIEPKAIKAFARHCGYLNPDFDLDLYRLDSEIRALSMEFRGSSISEKIILSRYDNSQKANLFKALDAIFEKSENAYREWNLLIERGEPSLKMLFILHKHIRQLLAVKLALSFGKTQLQIEKEMNLKAFVAKKYISQSKHFSLHQLYEFLEIAIKIDFNLKNSAMTTQEDIRMIFTLICRITEKKV